MKILLFHLGGLGDVCLSESVFLSLVSHFGKDIVAVGYKRYLELFSCYFSAIESFESRKWSKIIAGEGDPFDRIILVAKDRRGDLRRNLEKMSLNPLIFVEMYPEEGIHVEEYQLLQLKGYGIEPKKKHIMLEKAKRVILYPEKGYRKRKWPLEYFFELYYELKSRRIEVSVLKSIGLEVNYPDSLYFEDLKELKYFFQKGGVFVSNDCGVAHLASASGLYTVTIFSDADPFVWHPRVYNISLREEGLKPESVVKIICNIFAEEGI